jgi:nitrite reductase (NADH) small subunit
MTNALTKHQQNDSGTIEADSMTNIAKTQLCISQVSTNEMDGEQSMQRVCELSDLAPNSGVCALINDVQIAIFQLVNNKGHTSIYALSNWDPIGKANVMYRGLIGSISDEPVICSPLYKQHYSLKTGRCFESEEMHLSVYRCVVENQQVFVGLADAATFAA